MVPFKPKICSAPILIPSPSQNDTKTGDESHFRSIPWCIVYLNSPGYARLQGGGLASTSQTLFSQTFNTPNTISAAISLYRVPDPSQPITETVTFMAVGSGLNGHIDTLHGGTVAAILNGIAGLTSGVGEMPGGNPRLPIFTKYLHVDYLRPIKTPQILLVKARIEMVEGRKKRAKAQIRDQGVETLAECEALFERAREEGKL